MTWVYADHSRAVKLAGGPAKYASNLRWQGALIALGAMAARSIGVRAAIWIRDWTRDEENGTRIAENAAKPSVKPCSPTEATESYVYLPFYEGKDAQKMNVLGNPLPQRSASDAQYRTFSKERKREN